MAFELANDPGGRETMATDNPTNEPSLPTARRGYDREATDKLLALSATAGRLSARNGLWASATTPASVRGEGVWGPGRARRGPGARG